MAYLQIMADALTMWEELGRIENTKVCFEEQHLQLVSRSPDMYKCIMDQHAN